MIGRLPDAITGEEDTETEAPFLPKRILSAGKRTVLGPAPRRKIELPNEFIQTEHIGTCRLPKAIPIRWTLLQRGFPGARLRERELNAGSQSLEMKPRDVPTGAFGMLPVSGALQRKAMGLKGILPVTIAIQTLANQGS